MKKDKNLPNYALGVTNKIPPLPLGERAGRGVPETFKTTLIPSFSPQGRRRCCQKQVFLCVSNVKDIVPKIFLPQMNRDKHRWKHPAYSLPKQKKGFFIRVNPRSSVAKAFGYSCGFC
jgi:hypothetical protein